MHSVALLTASYSKDLERFGCLSLRANIWLIQL